MLKKCRTALVVSCWIHCACLGFAQGQLDGRWPGTGDALAAVASLKTRKEIDPARSGLLGHSERGLVAPLAATRSRDVAFIVLMSGPSFSGEQILLEQNLQVGRGEGMPEAGSSHLPDSPTPDARSLHRISAAAMIIAIAPVLRPTFMITSCGTLPRACPAAIGNIELPALQNASRDIARVSLSFAHSKPVTTRKMPCIIPRKRVDNTRRGTAMCGTARPTISAQRNRRLPS